MIKTRQLKPWTPEIILLAETLFYWIASSTMNYIAMGLVLILVLQMVYKINTAKRETCKNDLGNKTNSRND